MADPSREALAPVEAQFNAHPAIQAFLRSGSRSIMDWMRAVSQASRETGVQMPHDYQPAVQDGRVVLKKKSFIQRNGWFLPAVAVGAPIAAGAALGAIGGSAAASAAGAGGVGVGETGAVTGLAGSGFGAGGGMGLTAVTGGAGAGTAWQKIARAAAGAAPAIVPAVASHVAGGNNDLPPELQQILDLQRQRMLMQNPLYESILKMAQSRLPTSAQQGPFQLPQLSQPQAPGGLPSPVAPPAVAPEQAVKRLASNRRPR